MQVNLDNLVSAGEINKHKTTPREIRLLLKMADDSIVEAESHTSNADWKFKITYSAIVNLADAALRAYGYRTRSASSHYYTLKSLKNTINLEDETMRMIDMYRELRHQVTYVESGVISENLAEEIIQLSYEIQKKVLDWLEEKYPDLIKD
jgi:uncharacterized protein (UPF0332 family)